MGKSFVIWRGTQSSSPNLCGESEYRDWGAKSTSGKEKILQKIRPAQTLFTWQAGESCKPSRNGLEQETSPAQPAAPKVSAQHGKLMVTLSE